MPTYTGIVDSNGDFTIPFSSKYNAGQKITVVAEKDGATKSIEIYAPSSAIGASIEVSGSMLNFPLNVGDVTINMAGRLQDYAFSCVNASATYNNFLGRAATSITLVGCTELGVRCFEYSSVNINNILSTPTLIKIDNYAFAYVRRSQAVSIPPGKTWGIYVFDSSLITEATFQSGVAIIPIGMFYQCAALEKVSIPATVTEIQNLAFASCAKLSEITVLATTPPIITSDLLRSSKSTGVIKVPSESLAAYKTAPNWSAFASRIQAI